MKKALLTTLLVGAMAMSVSAASELPIGNGDGAAPVAVANSQSAYPVYLDNKPNYPLAYGLNDVAYYVDLQSKDVKINNDDFTIVATYVQGVDFDGQKHVVRMHTPRLLWFYYNKGYKTAEPIGWDVDGRYLYLPPYQNANTAFVSFDAGRTWVPFDVKAQQGMPHLFAQIFGKL